MPVSRLCLKFPWIGEKRLENENQRPGNRFWQSQARRPVLQNGYWIQLLASAKNRLLLKQLSRIVWEGLCQDKSGLGILPKMQHLFPFHKSTLNAPTEKVMVIISLVLGRIEKNQRRLKCQCTVGSYIQSGVHVREPHVLFVPSAAGMVNFTTPILFGDNQKGRIKEREQSQLVY